MVLVIWQDVNVPGMRLAWDLYLVEVIVLTRCIITATSFDLILLKLLISLFGPCLLEINTEQQELA